MKTILIFANDNVADFRYVYLSKLLKIINQNDFPLDYEHPGNK